MIHRALCVLLAACFLVAAAAPGYAAETGVSAILPNGRQIHPVGNWIPLAPYPFALAITPDGSQIAIPSIGFPFALNLITNPASAKPLVQRLPPVEIPASRDRDNDLDVHAGLAYSPDGSVLWVATGDSGKVEGYRTRAADGSPQLTPGFDIPLDGPTGGESYSESFAATVLASADGRTLFALDQGNWRIVVIDVATRQRIASIATGRYPMNIALAPDGSRLYVTNTGLFEYTTIPGTDARSPLASGLRFPPFGYPSRAAREGVRVDGRRIPGLGDENSLEGSSLWTYDVHDPNRPKITARLHLGVRISEAPRSTIGGSAPTGVAADSDAVYVTLAHDDAVVKVSADGTRVLDSAQLSPFAGPEFGARFRHPQGRPLRGVMPSGIAVHDGRIYVAESGIDAVAVLEEASLQLIEHIPVGWNPTAVALSPDGATLYVVNTKGKGAGPNGGSEHKTGAPTYVGSLELGSLSVIPLDHLPGADALTRAVVSANLAAVDRRAPLPRLRHCFLIIRENRTFDEVLGDLPGVNGDPSLARYGMDGWAQEDLSISHLRVTPNLHALAKQFGISDNYFVDSDVSADGHRWVLGIDPTTFFNTAWTSGYGGKRNGSATAAQPGRRAMFGGADAPMPEDLPQFGSLWEHIANSGKGVLNYGESLEIEGSDEMNGSAPEGQRLFLNAPVPEPVFEFSDRRYPTFNLGIPDQFRVQEFERDFRRRLARGSIPALIVIRLPNDHTADPRPADGYPYRASYVADNDLALGRIVAFLSRTSIWRDSAVFVTEDDAQSGVDHVDAHRSILLVASPWVRPGSVSHQHTSMGSIIRTIDELLGLGPLNLEDALAGEITDIFDDQRRLETYAVRPADPRVFDPAKAHFAKPKTAKEAAALRDMDDAVRISREMERSAATLHRPRN
ncbi:MAG TPA: bifunctional YncE family protein/alkaline phosphatase family protein [Acidobacteriaceae bacterium]|nr:bifunctional YncE family protein/alkaline phosphatase family protein [Acidobacteriaceae bacterium]